MKTMRFTTINRPIKVRGLNMQQVSLVNGYAGGDKMKTVIGLIAQGAAMSFRAANQFCVDHPTEAAQVAAEVARITVRK